MRRLFLRIYLALGAVLLAAVVIVALLRPEPQAVSIEDQIQRLIDADPALVTARFAGAGPEELESITRALSDELGHPVQVLPEAAVVGSVGGFARRSLGEGTPIVQLHDSGPAIYLPLDSTFVAVVRPGVRPPPLWQGRRGLLSALAFLAAVGVGVYLSVRPLERQLESLTRAATRVGGGELDARADVLRDDAGGRLAARFNAMADRVERMVDGRRTLLHGVSHELRTPVARLKFALELLGMAATAEEREKRIGHILADIEELETLVSELLRYAELEGDSTVEPLPLNLKDVVAGLAADADRVRDGVKVTSSCERKVPAVVLDQRLVERAVGNLVNNAVRHARSRVVVRAAVEGDEVCVHVDDDGPGVPKGDRARIFEPFTRLDTARSRDTGGIGLGLALAMRAAEAQGATLRVDEAPELGGARFTWAVPRP